MSYCGCSAFLPLNPQGLSGVTGDLLFLNTAASFTTNTNWQNYGGESTMSYLSQMVALACHNFFSAALGIAVAAALVRGVAGTGRHPGEFLVRPDPHLPVPAAPHLPGVRGVSGVPGMIQNFKAYDTATVDEA